MKMGWPDSVLMIQTGTIMILALWGRLSLFVFMFLNLILILEYS